MNKSSSDKKKNTESTPWNGPPPQTERELLDFEARTAKTALVQTVRAAARNLVGLADPRPWTQEHPWKSTGFAAVAGFVVATQVTPSGNSAEATAQRQTPTESPSPSNRTSSWDMVTSLLLSTGTNAMKSALTPWLAQKVAQVLQGNEAPVPEVEPLPPSEPPEINPS